MRLIYSTHWAADPVKTWSGTTYNLRKALVRRADIVDYEIPALDSLPLFAHKVAGRLGRKDFDLDSIQNGSTKFWANCPAAPGDVVFQFDECPMPREGSGLRHYIYFDNCVEFLYRSLESDIAPYLGVAGVRRSGLMKRLESQRDFFANADGIFTMGHWLAEYLVNECGLPSHKVHYAGGGSNLAVPPSSHVFEPAAPVFLFVGRDFKRKGGPEVLEAFSLIRAMVPGATLLVAGPKDDPTGGADGVKWLGDVTNDEVARLMGDCDVFVMPSYFEAFGIVFPEALSCGVPCVGRDVCEMPYFIEEGKNGTLVRSSDICELATAMLKCVTNADIRKGAAAAKDEVSCQYSWDAVAARIIEVIEHDQR